MIDLIQSFVRFFLYPHLKSLPKFNIIVSNVIFYYFIASPTLGLADSQKDGSLGLKVYKVYSILFTIS